MVTSRQRTAKSPLVDAHEMAAALGVSRWQIYELAKRDALPLRTIRVGQGYRWSRAALERLLAGELEPRGAGDGDDDRG